MTEALASILFVDDEPAVLEGIRRALRGRRVPWRMRFHSSPDAALLEMARGPADVVVSDLHMPARDGLSMITAMRAYEVNSKAVQSAEEMAQIANQLVR